MIKQILNPFITNNNVISSNAIQGNAIGKFLKVTLATATAFCHLWFEGNQIILVKSDKNKSSNNMQGHYRRTKI